jgi:hypothetical protein
MVQTTKSEVTVASSKGRSTKMFCEEWSRILRWYRNAVRIYSDAADVLDVEGTPGFNAAWEMSEEARKACARFRATLLEHEHRHGCQAPEPVKVNAIKTRLFRARQGLVAAAAHTQGNVSAAKGV